MHRPLRACLFLLISCPVVAWQGGCQATEKTEKPPDIPDHALPPLEPAGKEYHTPLAGEGFQTEVFGEHVPVQPRDRRSVTAWDAGAVGLIPGITGSEVTPFASLFFWRRPDEDTFLRAVVVGVYDEVFFSKSAQPFRPFEGVLTFNNLTVPIAQAEQVDGKRVDEEELLWGTIRPGIGFGYRNDLEEPGHVDNMLAVTLTMEPGYMYFDDGKGGRQLLVRRTRSSARPLPGRLDAMGATRSSLPPGHRHGQRPRVRASVNWEDWGLNGTEAASEGRTTSSAATWWARRVPFASDRHTWWDPSTAGRGRASIDSARFLGGRTRRRRITSRSTASNIREPRSRSSRRITTSPSANTAGSRSSSGTGVRVDPYLDRTREISGGRAARTTFLLDRRAHHVGVLSPRLRSTTTTTPA
jgi:hypothetical protein